MYTLEAKTASRLDPLRRCTAALIHKQYKLIYYTGYPDFETQYELYDLVNDPEELNDLYTSYNPIAKEMKSELEAQLAKATEQGPGATHHDEMHGIQPSDYMVRLSNGQAVIALRQLSRLQANLRHRRAIAEAFRRELSERGFQTIKPPAGAQPPTSGIRSWFLIDLQLTKRLCDV